MIDTQDPNSPEAQVERAVASGQLDQTPSEVPASIVKHLRGFESYPPNYTQVALEEIGEFLADLVAAQLASNDTTVKRVKTPHSDTPTRGQAEDLELQITTKRFFDPNSIAQELDRYLYLTDIANLLDESFAFLVNKYTDSPAVADMSRKSAFNVTALQYASTSTPGMLSESKLFDHRAQLQEKAEALALATQALLESTSTSTLPSFTDSLHARIQAGADMVALWSTVIEPLAQAFKNTPTGTAFTTLSDNLPGIEAGNYAVKDFPEIFGFFARVWSLIATRTEFRDKLNTPDRDGRTFFDKLQHYLDEAFYFKPPYLDELKTTQDGTTADEFIRFFTAVMVALGAEIQVAVTETEMQAAETEETEGGETEPEVTPVIPITIEDARDTLVQLAFQRLYQDLNLIEKIEHLEDVDPQKVVDTLYTLVQDNYAFPRNDQIEHALRNFSYTDANNTVQALFDANLAGLDPNAFLAHQQTLFTQIFKAFFDQLPAGLAEREAFGITLLNQVLALLGIEVSTEEVVTEEETPAQPTADEQLTGTIVPPNELLEELKDRYQRDQAVQALTLEAWDTLYPEDRLKLLQRERVRLVSLLRNNFLETNGVKPELLGDQLWAFDLIVDDYVRRKLESLSPEEQLKLLHVTYLTQLFQKFLTDSEFRLLTHLEYERILEQQLGTLDPDRSEQNTRNLRRRTRAMLILYGEDADDIAEKLDEQGDLGPTLFGYEFAQQLRNDDERQRAFIELAKEYLRQHRYELEIKGGKERLSEVVAPLMPLDKDEYAAFNDPEFLRAHLGYISEASRIDENYFFRPGAYEASWAVHQGMEPASYKPGLFQKGSNALGSAFGRLLGRQTPVEKSLHNLKDVAGIAMGTATGNALQVAAAAAALALRNRRIRELIAALIGIAGIIAWQLLQYLKPLLEALRIISSIQAGWSSLLQGVTNSGRWLLGSATSRVLPNLGAASSAQTTTGVLGTKTTGVLAKGGSTGFGMSFNQLGFTAPAGAMAVTAGVALLTNASIQSAFLEPVNLEGTIDDVSRYVSLEKSPDPRKSDLPTTVTYTITLQAKEQYRIRITGAEDVMRVTHKDKEGPTTAPGINPADAVTSLIGQEIGPDAPVSITYSVPFGPEYNDAAVSNTFRITFDVVDGEQVLTNQVAAITSRVCFGDCPTAECVEILDSGSVARTSAPWPADQKAMVEQTIDNLLAYPYFFDLLCSTGKPVKLFKATGGLAGWGIFYHRSDYDEIYFNDGPFVSSGAQDARDYIFAHEFTHVVDFRNDRLANRFDQEAPWSGSMFTYPLQTDKKLQEAFAEAAALYVTQGRYPVYNLQSQHPNEYNWVERHVFGVGL